MTISKRLVILLIIAGILLVVFIVSLFIRPAPDTHDGQGEPTSIPVPSPDITPSVSSPVEAGTFTGDSGELGPRKLADESAARYQLQQRVPVTMDTFTIISYDYTVLSFRVTLVEGSTENDFFSWLSGSEYAALPRDEFIFK